MLAVYSENYLASVAYLAGNGATTVMKDGHTASDYLTGFGARLGMTAGQFAAYIVGETRRVGPTAYEVEDESLRLGYGVIPAETSIDELLDLPNQYGRYCQ